MLQLIIHDKGTVLEVVPSLLSVEVRDKTVKWHNGEMREIQSEFVLLSDEVDVGEKLTPDQLALDQTASLQKEVTQEEIMWMKERLNSLLS